MVSELITRPDSYLQRKVTERSVWQEAILVFVVGALGSVGQYYVLQKFLQSTDTAGYTLLNGVGYVIEPVLGILVFWIGGTITAHFLANYFSARGQILRLLKLSAWAIVPIGLGNAVRSLVLFVAYNGVDPDTVSIDADSFDARFAEFQDLHMTDPVVVVGSIVLVLTVIWTGYLLSIGVRSSKQNISVTEAYIAAGVPTGAFAFYLLYSLATLHGVL